MTENDSNPSQETAMQSASRWEDTLGFRDNAQFANTRWSIVRRAQDGSESVVQEALSQVCRNYWYPLYAYVRRSGQNREQAEDLTQGFFARLLENDLLAEARQEKGKLRTFLLTVMKRFMIKEWKRSSAQKRGGGMAHLPINFDDGEQRYSHEPVDTATPDEIYQKQWAATLLARVIEKLRLDYEQRDMSARYEALQDAIWWNSNESSYAALGEQLGMKENAVKQAVSRLRSQYRRLLKDEIRDTLHIDDEQAVDDELACLISVLRGG